MELFRIARVEHANLDGIGSLIVAGRWHQKGVRCIYAASSRSLAMLEYLAHITSPSLLPENLLLITIYVPDNLVENSIVIEKLSRNWKTKILYTRNLGSKHILEGKKSLIRVPSAIVEQEYNYLINPLHEDFKKIKIIKEQPFSFDQRLLH